MQLSRGKFNWISVNIKQFIYSSLKGQNILLILQINKSEKHSSYIIIPVISSSEISKN